MYYNLKIQWFYTVSFDRFALLPIHRQPCVAANPPAGGIVSGGGTYNESASVTVTAYVYSGFNFINWTENNAQVSANSAYTFTMGTADRSLTANFETVTTAVYSVSVSSDPAAGGTVSGGGTYAQGADVTVTATPNSGYSFVNWTEGGSPVSNSASYTFTMLASDRTMTANFSTTTPSSGGDGDGGGSTPLTQPVNSTNGTATVAPTAGGAVSLGSDVSLKIPANALQGSNSVQVAVQKTDSPPSAPSGFMIMGTAYRFTVNGQDHYHFNQPVTLTFSFDPSRLAPGETPAVYYYDETKGQWVNIGGTVSGNTITVTVDHFTKYAVMAEKTVQTPAQKLAVTLTDISGHWAEASINKLVAMGAISGYPDGTFKPDNTITRAEFATVLVKAFKLGGKGGKVFADTEKHWAKNAISTASAYGIVNGYDKNTFAPDDPVTREQMAVMTVKEAKLSPGGQVSFADAGDIPDWARDSVAAAVQKGLMKGYPDNTFRPGDKATRAEAVTVIVNVLQ